MNKTVIISHDAGGAEIISNYIKYKKLKNLVLVLKGPAISVFKKNKIKSPKIKFNQALKIGKVFITGTSWSSSFEIKALRKIVSLKKKSITFLDHFCDFKKRFLFKNKYYFPDELWTFDESAYKNAKKTFHKKIKIKKKKNFLIENIKKKILKLRIPKNYKYNYLFLSQPIKNFLIKKFNNAELWGYNEFDALKFFLENIKKLNQDINSITIRMHPSEKKQKYKKILKKYKKYPIKINKGIELEKDLSKNYFCFGCNSYSMHIAAENKNKVFSLNLNQNKKFDLKHKNIINFPNYLKKNELL